MKLSNFIFDEDTCFAFAFFVVVVVCSVFDNSVWETSFQTFAQLIPLAP